MSAGRQSWVVEAPPGRAPSYVSQSFAAARAINVEFCLRAASAASTTIVRLEPGGISLELRHGNLELSVSRAGRLRAAGRRVGVAGLPTDVDLAVSGAGDRVQAYAGGVEQGSFAGRALAPRVIQFGRLAASPAISVTLSGLTIATSAGQLIPAPASSAPATPGTQAGPPTPAPMAGTAPAASGGASSAPAGGGATTVAPSGASTPGGTGTGSPGSSATSPGNTLADAGWPGNPFSPTSFWNAPLAATAPLDPNSQAYVNELLRQVNSYGVWMNTTSYSVPVYVVGPQQATQHVTLDTWGPDLQAAFDAVPIPAGAKAAAGSDAHMVVWQPSTDKMWEFWQMHQESDGWHAQWGGEMDNVSTNPGYFTHEGQTTNWGATATGLPLLGGLVTAADLQRGYINHALAISIVEAQKQYWSWPAQRTDGNNWTPGITPIPEGTRFRLDPTLNIGSLNLPPIDRMLAQAAQTYGMVVRDQAGSVSFYGQDPVSMPSNPWPAAFENQYPNQVLELFPWSHLQALQTQLSCCGSPSP